MTDEVRRSLGIGAYPDDIDFGASAKVAQLCGQA
jgi:LmbE family N-acetylglucosaminyl deacetylase